MNFALTLAGATLVATLSTSELCAQSAEAPPPASAPRTRGLRTVFAALPGTDRIAFHCAFPFGYAEEPDLAACARILAAALRADVPELAADSPVTAHVTKHHTWVGAVIERETLTDALQRVRAWLTGDLSLSDAALERARDVAVLAMDDAARTLPGPILRDLAQRALLGTTSTIDAATIERASTWSVAEVRVRLSALLRRDGAALAFVGGADADALSREVSAALADLQPAEGSAHPVPASAVRPREIGAIEEHEHDRVLAPFVTLAFRVPTADPLEAAGFRVAFELLRKRLVTEIGKPRGGEARAQFPAFHLDAFDGELAYLGRRGEPSDSAGTTRAEIETSLDRAMSIPIGPAELAAVQAQLVAAMAVPPLQPRLLDIARRLPSVQLERARLLLADELFGFPTSLAQSVATIDAATVQRCLTEHFGSGARAWFALVPRKIAVPARR